MKAIIEKGTTYKITGEKGSFFITEDNRGKAKCFQMDKVEVIEISEMPKAKKYSKCGKLSPAAHAAFQADLRECRRLNHIG
jgi:hypothetical protein